MIQTSIEKLAKEIGFDIGNSSDNVQADLLNGFCHGVHDSIKNRNNLDMQLCYIAKHLDNKTYEILQGIVEFIELKNKEEK